MMRQFHVFFSNRVELLFTQLKKELFASSDPFARRMVIVPSPAMKSWLLLQMAQDSDLGIAAGLEIYYLEQAISFLSSSTPMPSALELALALEVEIRKIVHSAEKVWEPLLNYLKIEEGILSRKSERRLVALTEKLAALFLQYGKHAGAMVAEWEKGKEEWQARLWKSIFAEKWNYPYRAFSSDNLDVPDAQIYLFATSHVSRLQHMFLTRVSEKIPVHYYVLSPCQAFWSDISSDREQRKQLAFWEKKGASQEQLDDLEEYLRNRNPLLANFGRMGREMAVQIEESVTQTEEKYVSTENTLLENVQKDMLFLINPDEKMDLDDKDKSIQLHISTSKMREVEVLYETLMGIIDRDVISPSEILVMAPDIMDYVPFIKWVFGSKESALDFQIMDMQMPAQNVLVRNFLHLLSLPETRWEASSLLELFESPYFQQKHAFSTEDLNLLRKWIQKFGVRWGENAAHRNELLHREHSGKRMVEDSPVGTWEYGLGRLLEAMVTTNEVDATKAKILGKVIQILRSLREDLKPLVDGSEMTLKEWSVYLECLYEAYFFDDQFSERDLLLSHLATFRKIALPEAKFGFSSIKRHLETAFKKEKVCYRETHLNAIRFCSMLPMRAIPSEVVVLLGMEEGAYPKQEQNFSLNLMKGRSDTDYYPSQTDYDRYLFLEMLLSARRYFVMSYQGTSKDLPPSLLVTELFEYLDRGYSFKGKKPREMCVQRHPFHSFTSSSYSYMHYRMAQAFYGIEKKTPHLIHDFAIRKKEQERDESINIKQLAAMARNPIQVYFNRTLGIYLEREEDRLIKDEEEFQLSALRAAIVRKKAFSQSFEELIDQVEKEGHLPLGAFKQLDVEKVRQEVEELRLGMENIGVKPTDFYEILSSEQCKKSFQESSGKWCVPPLTFGKVKIVGKVEGVTPQGLAVYGKDDKQDVVKWWPQFLFFHCLSNTYSLPFSNQLIFSKSGQVKKPFFNDSENRLEHYLDYYFTGLHNMSPLIPEWIPDLLNNDAATLQKKVRSAVSPLSRYFYNDYARWMMRDDTFPDSEVMMSHWKEWAERLFQDVYNNWYH